MNPHRIRSHAARLSSALALCASLAARGAAQKVVPAPQTVAGADSVTIAAGPEYASGGLHSFLFGDNYRVFWTTPIRVAVLNLHTFAGGLEPKKKGGGMQTESLRFSGKDGEEYAFRTVNKRPHLPPGVKGSIAMKIVGDQISSEHPAAALVAAVLLEAAGVLHATPQLVVMPHDSILGEYAKEFAGRLGLIEVSPEKTSDKAEGFAGAVEIIDSDSLRKLLDSDGRERIDARALLKARLTDIFLNDIDRHPGQWKWARMEKGHTSLWEPIPRDRDQAFVAYHGVLLRVGRLAAPNLVTFDGDISIPGLTYNSLEMDRRLLSGLERPVWDSIVHDLTGRLTDAVIDSAVRALPAEFRWSAPAFASTLKLRREHLARAAGTLYSYLSGVVDVHGTDGADRLTAVRLADGRVDVELATSGGVSFFHRRFDPADTREIRVYLHGGDDTSLVSGDVQSSIELRVIGGNGVNWLVDSSKVGGRSSPTDLLDAGSVSGVSYGVDTLFSRLPFFESHGRMLPPVRDYGTKIAPVARVRTELVLGITPTVGIEKYNYGFRARPYSSAVGVEAEYATAIGSWAFRAHADKRWEATPFHAEVTASTSELDLLEFHGLGNDTPDSASGFFDVRQRQWQVHPAIAYALGETSDLSLGPVLRFSHAESAPNRLISSARPYGSGNFSEAGARLAFRHDEVDNANDPHRRIRVDLTGTLYPAILDVTHAYEVVDARVGSLVTIAMVTDPVLVWRAGATKTFGDAPFFDAASIGGNHTLLRMEPQRFAGDEALYASSELRIPLMSFAFLVPMRAGILGSAEAGRVYVHSSSPGGWHTSAGGGVWVGFSNQSFIVSCTVTNDMGARIVHCQTGLGL